MNKQSKIVIFSPGNKWGGRLLMLLIAGQKIAINAGFPPARSQIIYAEHQTVQVSVLLFKEIHLSQESDLSLALLAGVMLGQGWTPDTLLLLLLPRGVLVSAGSFYAPHPGKEHFSKA